MARQNWERLGSTEQNFGDEYCCRSTCVQMMVNEALHFGFTLGMSKQLGGDRQYAALGVVLASK